MRCETSHLCFFPDRGPTTAPAAGPALPRRLHRPPLPDPAGQRRRAAPSAAIARNLGCAAQTVRNAIHAFAREGLACLQAEVLPAPLGPALPGRALPSPAGPAAPQPPHASASRPACGRWTWSPRSASPGLDPAAAQRRDDPPGPEAAGRPLAAGQALDHQPRPGVRAKKKARDRLIRLAATHPDWVLGFGRDLVEPAGPADACTPGPRTSRCGWSSGRRPGRTRTPRRWPATGCCGATPAGCCCGSWRAGRSAR